MRTDLINEIDQNNSTTKKQSKIVRWSNGLHRIKRNRPIAFAFVIALSLALSACMGETKIDYMGYIYAGNNQLKNNDFPNAIESYNKAVEAGEKKYGKDSPQVATALGYLGQIYRSQGEWRLCYMTYKRLLPLKEQFEPKARETQELKNDFEVVKQKIIEYGISTDDGFGAEQIKKNKGKSGSPSKGKKKHHHSD